MTFTVTYTRNGHCHSGGSAPDLEHAIEVASMVLGIHERDGAVDSLHIVRESA